MNLTTRMIIVLTAIAMLSGGILAGWDALTKPKIEHHRLVALQNAIAEVLPPHDRYETRTEGEITMYIGHPAESDSIIGIAFQAVGSGFQGEVRIMVGAAPGFKTLTGMKVLEQIETPGLGTKIVTDPSNKANPLWFPEQYIGVSTEPEIVVIKNVAPSKPNEVQGITGATISSVAVTNIINNQLARVAAAFGTEEG